MKVRTHTLFVYQFKGGRRVFHKLSRVALFRYIDYFNRKSNTQYTNCVEE